MKIAVLTSNAYHGLLPAFAYLFNHHWHDHDAPVEIVGYDAPVPKLPGNFTFTRLGKQTDFTFSSGLLTYLNTLSDEHIMLFLEDYYLDKPVNAGLMKELEMLMVFRPDIGKIDLTDDRGKVPHHTFNGAQVSVPLIISEAQSGFQMSLQAAMWRVDFLKAYLDPKEDAWSLEKAGTKRLIQARMNGTEGRAILGCTQPPVHYVNACGNGEPGVPVRKRFSPDLWNELMQRGLL